MKLGRRQILLAGLGSGVAATIFRNYQRLQTQSRLEALARQQSQLKVQDILKETLAADAKKNQPNNSNSSIFKTDAASNPLRS